MPINTRFFILTLCVLALLSQLATAAESVGKIVFVKGKATVLRLEPKGSKDLNFNDDIFAMDTVETKNGSLKILFEDQTVMSLSENSKVLITEQIFKPKQGVRKSIFDVLKGKVRTIVEKVAAEDSDVKLQTPTAVAGIRGTDVGIQVEGNRTQFLCFDGLVETYFKGAPEQKVMLEAGQLTTIQSAAPSTPENIPADVQKQFRPEAPALKEVLNQSGGQGLNKKEFLPPPPPAQENHQEAVQNNKKQDQRSQQQNQQVNHQDQQSLRHDPAPQSPDAPPAQGPQGPPPPQAPLLPGGTQEVPVGLAPPGPTPGTAGTSGGGAGAPAPTPTAPTTTPVDVPMSFPVPG